MEHKTELQRNALAEERRLELDFYQRAMDIKWLNSRMEDGRMGRCLALIAREEALEKEFKKRTDHEAFVNARAEQETNLAHAIEDVRREEQNTLLRRQYLRENDPGLIELQKRLQSAYNRKDLEQQILHKEYKRLQDKTQAIHANALLNKALLDEKRAKEKAEYEKMVNTSKYCAELQQQLVNRQQQKQCEYEDTLIEKKMLDDVIRTISDEDKRELEQKQQQIAKCRQEMVTFKQAQDAWKEKQKMINSIEEKQIEAQKKMVMNRTIALEEERIRKLRLREEINEKIAAKILAEEAERQERFELVRALQEQEYLEKHSQDDLNEKEKLNKIRKETAENHAMQIAFIKKRNEEERIKDAAYRKANEEKLAAEIAKEHSAGSKKKQMQQEYIRELKLQIERNRETRAREKEDEAARARAVRQYQNNTEQEVSDERSRMLEQHGAHVVGFLQPGVLHHRDLPHVKAGASRHPELASLDIDAMSVRRRNDNTKFPKCNAQCRILRHY